VKLSGSEQTLSTTVYPHRVTETIFPAEWYVTDVSTVQQLGSPGALVINPGTTPSQTQPTDIPLIAALPFLAGGITQIVRTLSVAAFGGGLLILVVVYNVTRMSIRDRRRLIGIARATGASPSRLFAVLLTRVLILSTAGIALGYAIGVVATNAVINIATYAGLPVSIQTNVSPEIATTLLGISGFLLAMGLAAGAFASIPTVRGDPTFSGGNDTSRSLPRVFGRVQNLLAPTLVDWRAFVPTAATLAVFMLIILLTGAIGGAIAPLATTSSGTIVESGAAHPLNSRISEDYATVLRSHGIEASPEVVYAQSRGTEPYLIRGANYSAFSSVTDASITQGHPPTAADEAVIGASLAQTLGVDVG
ncbi:ABC transporter permease, partial [Haloferax profundi]|uniref:ABC transporter permease n=1 Tax=Haloferax profundi TaxID=1544718 RepID=UPI0012FBBF60